MAIYQDKNEVVHKESDMFKPTYEPGVATPRSGIYICINCKDEVASNAGNPLPPQNHRQHKNTSVPIEWRLLVCTQNGPD